MYITATERWGSIFTIRTGPAEFGQALVTYIKNRTPYRQQDGGLVDTRTGALVPTPDERDYFAVVGLRYVPPEKRNCHTVVPVLQLWRRDPVPSCSPTPHYIYNRVDSPAEQVSDRTANTAQAGTVVYTDDISVRAAIRARLEAVLFL